MGAGADVLGSAGCQGARQLNSSPAGRAGAGCVGSSGEPSPCPQPRGAHPHPILCIEGHPSFRRCPKHAGSLVSYSQAGGCQAGAGRDAPKFPLRGLGRGEPLPLRRAQTGVPAGTDCRSQPTLHTPRVQAAGRPCPGARGPLGLGSSYRQGSALPLASWVALSKGPGLPGPQFAHLWNGDNGARRAYPLGLR